MNCTAVVQQHYYYHPELDRIACQRKLKFHKFFLSIWPVGICYLYFNITLNISLYIQKTKHSNSFWFISWIKSFIIFKFCTFCFNVDEVKLTNNDRTPNLDTGNEFITGLYHVIKYRTARGFVKIIIYVELCLKKKKNSYFGISHGSGSHRDYFT